MLGELLSRVKLRLTGGGCWRQDEKVDVVRGGVPLADSFAFSVGNTNAGTRTYSSAENMYELHALSGSTLLWAISHFWGPAASFFPLLIRRAAF